MGKNRKVTVGHKYHIGGHMVLSHGPVDSMNRIDAESRTAWSGCSTGNSIKIEAETLFGGADQSGNTFLQTHGFTVDNPDADGISGVVDVLMGGPTQTKNSYLQKVLGALIPAFRGVFSLVLNQVYVGNSPNVKPWSIWATRNRVRERGVPQWYIDKCEIITEGNQYELIKRVNFSCVSSYDGATVKFDGVHITDVSEGDVVRITKLNVRDGAYFKGWSPHDSDASFPNSWTNTFWVKKGSSSTRYWNYYFPSSAAADADAITREVITSGALDFWVGIQDTPWSDNRGGISLKIERKRVQRDQNPAHAIRERFTSRRSGLSFPEYKINDASFMAAADKLFAEKMGVSILLDKSKSVIEWINEFKRHIDADVYIDRAGLVTIKLIRDDYVFADLMVFDNSNIISIEKSGSTPVNELVNAVTVVFWNWETGKDASVQVADPAMVQMQGKIIPTTVQYPCFCNADIATRVAARDLRVLSSSLATFQLIVNRLADELYIGDRFILNRPDQNASMMVVRIIDLNFGDGLDNRIRMTVTQDVFSLPAKPVMVTSPDTKWIDPRQPASESPARLALELPYYELVQNLGQVDVDSAIATDNEMAVLGIAAVRPSGTALDAQVVVDADGTYRAISDTLDFCPSALLTAAMTKTQTNITFDGASDLDLVAIGSHCQIGNELLVVNALDAVASTATLGRGVLDTVPALHADNDRIYFWDAFAASDTTAYSEGETVNVKVLTNSTLGRLPESAAPIDSVTFTGRAARPYPPGNVKINGIAYPSSITSSADLTFTWSHRDRTLQTASTLQDTTYGNIGPEVGTTYTLRIYNQFNALIRTEAGLTGTTYSYTTTQEQIDNGGGGGASQIVDPQWGKTGLLLNFNGANGSTTFANSAGNFATVNGAAKIDTSQYKFNGASGWFSGNNTYLRDSIPSAIGTGDFAIELWVRREGDAAVGSTFTQILVDFRTAEPSTQIQIDIAGSTSGYAFGFFVNGAYRIQGGAATLNTWVFLQLIRVSGVTKMYANGTQIGSNYTDTNNYTATTFSIAGRFAALSSDYRALNGHCDDLRITKASRAAAVPTREFGKYVKDTNFSDYKLALIFEGANDSTAIIDRSDSGHTISVFGNAKLTTSQFKFGASCLDLDGDSASFISVPFSADFTGVNNITLEGYIRTPDVARAGTIAAMTLGADSLIPNGWLFGMDNTARLFAQGWTDVGGAAFTIYPTNTLSANTWYHVALVRNGGVWSIYLNGTSIGSQTETAAISVTGTALSIGRDQRTLIRWLGQFDDFAVRAFAAYTANFTVSSTSFLPIDGSWANVAYLCNFNGANNSTDFENIAEFTKTLTVNGNAQISTAQFKYGSASGYFDGTGDYLVNGDTSSFSVASGDFTAQCWIRPEVLTSIKTIVGKRAAGAGTSTEWLLVTDANGKLNVIAWNSSGSVVINLISTTTLTINTWAHVAFSKVGTTWRLFINGNLEGTGTQTGTPGTNTTPLYIGRDPSSSGSGRDFQGFMDDMRLEYFGRYTANFPLPVKEISKYISALNTQLRVELESVRDGLTSHQKHNHTITRAA